jgi:hypothetical protein
VTLNENTGTKIHFGSHYPPSVIRSLISVAPFLCLTKTNKKHNEVVYRNHCHHPRDYRGKEIKEEQVFEVFKEHEHEVLKDLLSNSHRCVIIIREIY